MRTRSQINSRPRKILLAVSGMSPQIITETLYALHREANWLPDEIHLVTTEEGRNRAELQLLAGKKHLAQFLKDYGIRQRIRLCHETMHVIPDKHGKLLKDLKTPADNEAAADCITAVIRDITAQPDTELHVSLAGGRKTMGFYAGYALSLYGRPQDKLSHVLVSSEYESLQDFFYPTKKRHVIHDRNGAPLDAAKAEVWLAEIPFVRLRAGLPKQLLDGKHSFSDTIELARKSTEKPHLVLYPRKGTFVVNGTEGKISSLELAIMLWFAERKQQGERPLAALVDGENDQHLATTLLDTADRHNINISTRTENTLKKEGLTQKYLQENVSRLNGRLEKQLGKELSALCKLVNIRHCQGKGYAFPDELHIEIE